MRQGKQHLLDAIFWMFLEMVKNGDFKDSTQIEEFSKLSIFPY
jgi:hypothetical protein